MNREELEERMMKFAVAVMKLVDGLPRTKSSDAAGYQLVKAATSVGANYEESDCAESRADFVHKLSIAQKEAKEARYWLRVLKNAELGQREKVVELLGEATELVAILVSSGRTASSR